MMKIKIEKSRITGKLGVPPSKSYAIRALMCAALAEGESVILNPLASEDTGAAIRVLGQVGVPVRREKGRWRVSGGSFHPPSAALFCGDSAATLRFMTALCSLVSGKCRLTAGPSLARRPVGPLVGALRDLGVDCSASNGLPPVTVNGGKSPGGLVEIAGNVSSQFISALLLLAPRTRDGMVIRLTTPLESKPYIRMTLACLREFGIAADIPSSLDRYELSRQDYRPTVYHVEGDWSSASYFLALGAVSGSVEVVGLAPDSLQGDRMMLNFLRDMGAPVETGPYSVTVRKARLKALRADLTDCPDLLPTVAALAAVANGTSRFTGIARARWKESDRVAAVKNGLDRMGIEVSEGKDSLSVVGSAPAGAVIDSRNDHRIAMAFSVLGTVAGGTVIDGAECVNKTFPQFWDILEGMGGELKKDV